MLTHQTVLQLPNDQHLHTQYHQQQQQQQQRQQQQKQQQQQQQQQQRQQQEQQFHSLHYDLKSDLLELPGRQSADLHVSLRPHELDLSQQKQQQQQMRQRQRQQQLKGKLQYQQKQLRQKQAQKQRMQEHQQRQVQQHQRQRAAQQRRQHQDPQLQPNQTRFDHQLQHKRQIQQQLHQMRQPAIADGGQISHIQPKQAQMNPISRQSPPKQLSSQKSKFAAASAAVRSAASRSGTRANAKGQRAKSKNRSKKVDSTTAHARVGKTLQNAISKNVAPKAKTKAKAKAKAKLKANVKAKVKAKGPTAADRRLKHNATERHRTFLISEKVAELSSYMKSIGRKFKNEKLHVLGTAVEIIEELIARKKSDKQSLANPTAKSMAATTQILSQNNDDLLAGSSTATTEGAATLCLSAQNLLSDSDVLMPLLDKALSISTSALFDRFPKPCVIFDREGVIKKYNHRFVAVFQGVSTLPARHATSTIPAMVPKTTPSDKIAPNSIATLYGPTATNDTTLTQVVSSTLDPNLFERKHTLWMSIINNLVEPFPSIQNAKFTQQQAGQHIDQKLSSDDATSKPHFVVVQDKVQLPHRTIIFEGWVSRCSKSKSVNLFQAVFTKIDVNLINNDVELNNVGLQSSANAQLPDWVRSSKLPVVMSVPRSQHCTAVNKAAKALPTSSVANTGTPQPVQDTDMAKWFGEIFFAPDGHPTTPGGDNTQEANKNVMTNYI